MMTRTRDRKVPEPEPAPEPTLGWWRVRIVEAAEGLEAELNEAAELGYIIDDIKELDAEPIKGTLRFLVISRLEDFEDDEPEESV